MSAPADPWYDELYLDTTADLLGPALSTAEAVAIADLLLLRPGERVLDLACGHGRHLARLAGRGLRLAGIDRSDAALARAGRPSPHGEGTGAALARGDLRALPFRGGAFDAAWSWYSSLLVFDEGGNAAALAEAARVLRPGGRLLVEHANPLRLAREPEARAARELPGGGRAEEHSRFDPASGVETLSRRLIRGAHVVAGAVSLRYYNPDEWEGAARRAGLRLRALAATGREGWPSPFSEEALDLIAILEKPT